MLPQQTKESVTGKICPGKIWRIELKALIPEENLKLESIEGIFPKKGEVIKLKTKYIKLENGKKKVDEET